MSHDKNLGIAFGGTGDEKLFFHSFSSPLAVGYALSPPPSLFELERHEFISPVDDIGVLNLEFQATVLIPPLG